MIDKFTCQEGKDLNVTIIERNGVPVVDSDEIMASSSYPFRVVEGLEKLSDEGPPWTKRVEVTKCADDYAEVRILGDSLGDLIQ